MAAMAVDGTAAAEGAEADAVDVEAERFALDIHAALRTSQVQHGLKMGDFERYRKYCTRRLLRLYKSLKFKHGKGKFEQRELTAQDVTEPRHFLIPLLNAERSLGQAMEIKKAMEQDKKWISHRRHHMIKRLRRALQWADKAVALCSERADAKTILEAEAYANFVKGNYLMEWEQNWSSALQNFLQARAMYEKLGSSGSSENLALFRDILSELEPTILFCKYQVQKRDGTSKLSDLNSLKEAHVSPLLQSKLDSLVSDAEKSIQVQHIVWRKEKYAIPTMRLVDSTSSLFEELQKMTEKKGNATDKNDSIEKKLEAYGSLFTAFDNVKQILQSEKADAAGGGAVAMTEESKGKRKKLEAFERAIKGLLLECQVRRTSELIKSRWGKYIPCSSQSNERADTTPEEMIRLYEHLKLDIVDLSEIASSNGHEDEALYEECAIAIKGIKSLLCFFLAEQHNTLEQNSHAYLLYKRAIEYSDQLEDQSPNTLVQNILSRVKKVANLASIGRCISHAKACASDSVKKDQQQGDLGNSEASGAGVASQKDTLMNNLGMLASFAGVVGRCTYDIPPKLVSLPCQPFLMDTAIAHMKYPEIPVVGSDGKAREPTAEGAGGWGGLFGWGR